jgi:ADP-ribose pyrophosphatase
MRREKYGIAVAGHEGLGSLTVCASEQVPPFAGEEPTIGTVIAYQGDLVHVRLDTVTLPNGREITREIVDHPSSVCIVPVDSDGYVLLVRQYRKAVETFLLEAPAGKMEPGEDPAATALRELQEEVGHKAGELESLGSFYVAPGWCTQIIYAYLARELFPARLDADEDEFIEVVRTPLADIPALIASGTIRDAKSVASLLLATRVLGDN